MNTLVKITKLAPIANPEFKTPLQKDYKNGVLNDNVSLPVDYNVEGYLIKDIELQKCVIMNRQKRNGVEASGVFMTSPVTEITTYGFKTLNSVYLLEVLE